MTRGSAPIDSRRLGWRLLEAASAVGAAVFLHHLPLAEDDPLRSTLVVLPLVVVALRALSPARRAGGRRERRRGGFEAAALVALVLLTLGRRSLGLWATDWFIAAGFLMLLGHRVARLLLRWRRELAALPLSPPAALALLPLVVYLAVQPWSASHRQVDGDEPFYLLLAHSLAYDGDVDLANNYRDEDYRRFLDRPLEPQPGDPRGGDGEVFSRHNLVLPLLIAPAYRVAGRWGAMAVMAAITAALAWMVLRLAARYFPDPSPRRVTAAWTAYACFAFTPPLLIYSYQVWVEVPAALVLALALDRLGALRESRSRDARLVVQLAGLLVLLPLLKIRFALLALPVALLALRAGPHGSDQDSDPHGSDEDSVDPHRRGRPWLALLGLGAGLAALMAFNQWRYGNVLKIHSWEELDLFSGAPADFLRGFAGLFFDVAFGLVPSSPIWYLLLPGLAILVRDARRGGARRLLTDLLAVALPYLAVLSPRLEWYGGWSPPFRYGLVLLPLFALALVPVFEQRRRPVVRQAVAGLVVLTIFLGCVWVVVPGWTYNFADGRTHLLEQAGEKLGADVARLFPSTIRPRLATWLWPLAALAFAPAFLPAGGVRPGAVRSAAAWGLTTVLLGAALMPLLAVRWPTRTIEPEDAWVRKDRGWPFPERWVLQRPRYPSGWVVPPGGRLKVPIAPPWDAGTRRLTVRLRARAVASRRESGASSHGILRLLAVPDRSRPDRSRPEGSSEDGLAAVPAARRPHPLAELRVGGDWEVVTAGPVDWPDGAFLVLVGAADRAARGRPVAIDRLTLEWGEN